MAQSTPGRRPHLSTSLFERIVAGLAALALVGLGVMADRFGSRLLGESDAAVACAYASSFVALLVSAAILRNQFRASVFPQLSFLSNAFGISALVVIPFIAIMPHVFSPDGFGYGDQAVPWLWVLWHGAFTCLVIAYVAGEAYFSRRMVSVDVARRIADRYGAAAGMAAIASIALVLLFHTKLPVIDSGNGFTPFFHTVVERALLGASAIALVGLIAVTRVRQTTSLWLAVVLVALGVQTYFAGDVLHGAYTVAWYLVLGAGAVWQALYLVAQLRSANEQLAAYAADKKSLIETTLRDALTGLHNRRGFDERANDLANDSRLAAKPFSLLVFDIDHFKAFNDAFGHPAGDAALRAIAEAVGPVANRPSDACCRVGGEEFAIVLGETDALGAATVAERVRSAVKRLHIAQAPEIGRELTVSIGCATSEPARMVGVVELYERADKALYKAKRLGRDRIAVHAPREPGLRAVRVS